MPDPPVWRELREIRRILYWQTLLLGAIATATGVKLLLPVGG